VLDGSIGGAMPTTTLNALLTVLGIASAPRYPIEEVAQILGFTPKQVRTQIKKGNLAAVRGSLRRWTGVLHEDLDAYFTTNNGGAQ
jgi:hypothetical protein